MPNYARAFLGGLQGEGASALECLECGALIFRATVRHDEWHEKMEGLMEKKVTPVEPGDRLYGFCGGAFGRDSYAEKVVVAVGKDWVVAREDGRPIFAAVSPEELRTLATREGDDE